MATEVIVTRVAIAADDFLPGEVAHQDWTIGDPGPERLGRMAGMPALQTLSVGGADLVVMQGSRISCGLALHRQGSTTS